MFHKRKLMYMSGDQRNPAKIENVFEMLAGVAWREFRIRMRREVHLPHGGAGQDMVRCPRGGGAVRG